VLTSLASTIRCFYVISKFLIKRRSGILPFLIIQERKEVLLSNTSLKRPSKAFLKKRRKLSKMYGTCISFMNMF